MAPLWPSVGEFQKFWRQQSIYGELIENAKIINGKMVNERKIMFHIEL